MCMSMPKAPPPPPAPPPAPRENGDVSLAGTTKAGKSSKASNKLTIRARSKGTSSTAKTGVRY